MSEWIRWIYPVGVLFALGIVGESGRDCRPHWSDVPLMVIASMLWPVWLPVFFGVMVGRGFFR